MLEEGLIKDAKEKEKLEYLINTKKWNPYCIGIVHIQKGSEI